MNFDSFGAKCDDFGSSDLFLTFWYKFMDLKWKFPRNK